jgi:hypothetical protein
VFTGWRLATNMFARLTSSSVNHLLPDKLLLDCQLAGDMLLSRVD